MIEFISCQVKLWCIYFANSIFLLLQKISSCKPVSDLLNAHITSILFISCIGKNGLWIMIWVLSTGLNDQALKLRDKYFKFVAKQHWNTQGRNHISFKTQILIYLTFGCQQLYMII